MNKCQLPAGILLLSLAVGAVVAHASQGEKVTTFAVLRDDAQIGTDTIRVDQDGSNTTVQTVTHVEVKLGFLTLYRFDQTEMEKWADGQFQAMNATTDDNGAVHKSEANNANGSIVVNCDGKAARLAATAIPLSFWNSELLERSIAFNPEDGRVAKIAVIDRGEDNVVVHGRPTPAHHYVITAAVAQDVWYDESRQLVRAEFKGKDGSTIRYQLA